MPTIAAARRYGAPELLQGGGRDRVSSFAHAVGRTRTEVAADHARTAHGSLARAAGDGARRARPDRGGLARRAGVFLVLLFFRRGGLLAAVVFGGRRVAHDEERCDGCGEQ